jgi:Reverse transcriptase (RNA-dependent DNA polymerase)
MQAEVWGMLSGPGRPQVASMLCMDISGAFDYVAHARLIASLRNRKIPTVLIRWIQSFLIERTTTIKVFKGEL